MNKEEFSKFYDAHINKVFRFVYLRVNSAETAQDITAISFLKFWQRVSLSDSQQNRKTKDVIANPTAFLYRIARNRIIDFYRKKNKQPLSLEKLQEIADFQVAHATFKQNIELTWEVEEIKKSLQNISSLYADIIIWHYLDELSTKEISQILKKKEGTVRVLLHRGMKALKIQLDKEKKARM